MCCTFCKHEKAPRDRSEDNNVVGRTYPSLSFSRLAIDLVKPVKQVSIQWVFPGGRLIGWKVATNSVLYLKQKASRFIISPSVTQVSLSNEQKCNDDLNTFLYSSSTSLDAGSLTSPLVCSKAGKTTWKKRNLVETINDWCLCYISYVIV